MFENSTGNSFERTEIYFTVIEILRIASEWVQDNCREIEKLSEELKYCLMILPSYIENDAQLRRKRECYKVVKNNGKILTRKAKENETEFLEAIGKKTEEAKSLRDGVSSPSIVFYILKS